MSPEPAILTKLPVEDLHPNSRYEELCGKITDSTLFEMSQLGEKLFEDPLVATNTGVILDGYKRWFLARKQERAFLNCLVHTFTKEQEVLTYLVELQMRTPVVNSAYFRILLALELEPILKMEATERQSMGGKVKGSSNLTKVNSLDVRAEVARVAKVSAGNVTKVKQIVKNGIPVVIDALRAREISIHRAHGWSKESKAEQKERLEEWRNQKDIRSHINQLLSRHTEPDVSLIPDAFELAKLLTNFHSLRGVGIHLIKGRGKQIFLTETLARALMEDI